MSNDLLQQSDRLFQEIRQFIDAAKQRAADFHIPQMSHHKRSTNHQVECSQNPINHQIHKI